MPTEDDRLVSGQSRMASWAPTASYHLRMAKTSGREVLEAIQAGLLAPSPLARVIGLHIVAVGDGLTELALGRAGILRIWPAPLHGGVAASLLGSTLGAAVQSLSPPRCKSREGWGPRGEAVVTTHTNCTPRSPE